MALSFDKEATSGDLRERERERKKNSNGDEMEPNQQMDGCMNDRHKKKEETNGDADYYRSHVLLQSSYSIEYE